MKSQHHASKAGMGSGLQQSKLSWYIEGYDRKQLGVVSAGGITHPSRTVAAKTMVRCDGLFMSGRDKNIEYHDSVSVASLKDQLSL